MPLTAVAPFEFEDEDYHSLVMNLTGGFKAWQRSENEWSIGPILYNGQVVMAGVFSYTELLSGMRIMGLSWTTFEHRAVMSGVITTMWRSVEPVRPNSVLSATDIWQSIYTTSASERVTRFTKDFPKASTPEITSIREENTKEERLADYISDSLRSMDITISSISNYYHDQLTVFLREKREIGSRSSSVADLPFIANVHSFFVHFGAARDYLAALIAHRCGLPEKVDAMSRLLEHLKWDSLPDDAIVRTLVQAGCVSAKPSSTKVKLSGWLEEASDIRNQLVHQRPYGSLESEKYGQLQSAGGLEGHFRFFKPIQIGSKSAVDTLDYLSGVYGRTIKLFGEIALNLGADTRVRALNEVDIKSLKIVTGSPSVSERSR